MTTVPTSSAVKDVPAYEASTKSWGSACGRRHRIATEWISHYPSKELVVKYATFVGRPVIGIDKNPPRLYHRTLKDAAFSIFQEGMIAGHGESGNFTTSSQRRLSKSLDTRAGVRADYPVQTRSDGILTRDRQCHPLDPRHSQ